MKIPVFLTILIVLLKLSASAQLENGTMLFNRRDAQADADGFYHVSNYEFRCLRQLAICASHGWSLRFKLRLNRFQVVDRERKSLLFSTGAHEPHGDGMLVYLYQSKNTSYLEFGLKEFRNDQFAFYRQIEADLEVDKWVDVVTNIEQRQTSNGKHHQMTIFFDGRIYRETQLDNYTEVFVFKYDHLHPKAAIIFANDTDLATFDEMIYYERPLTEEEIADVAPDRILLGCLKNNDRVQQYLIPEKYSDWRKCREECFDRRMKVAFHSQKNGKCACVKSYFELETSFQFEKACKCRLPTLKTKSRCETSDDQWYILSASNVIDLIDAEVGLEIRLADSSYLTHGRTRVQINEGVEIIVTVKNERNLASLTVYGDIEGQDVPTGNSSSNEIYITAGVVNLSWKTEGAKKVQFRADYRRIVHGEMAEYRTVYVDVVFVKTDLPLQFVHLSPDHRDGHPYQNFTVQTFGSIPINCTLDYGDGVRQTNGTSRHQYYTAYFARNYTRYGQYNVSARCSNERSANTTSLIRHVRRERMNRKHMIYKDLMETSLISRFNLLSREDFSFRHESCLHLRNIATNEKMKLIWRKKTLEIIPNEILPVGKHFYQLECDSVPLQAYYLNVQPAIRSLDIDASQTTIKSGQSIQYFITLEPTVDLTIVFDCDNSRTPLQIMHLPQVVDMSPMLVANCTYDKPGQYHPLVSAINRINLVNQSIRIDVEEPLAPFKLEIEDQLDINQLTLVTIRALEKVPFEGLFTLTIIDGNMREKNQTRTERVQLLKSNDFTEQFYLNVSTYGRQTLHVRGGDFPTIREAQATFTIGTEITSKPQAFILNPLALANAEFTMVDLQWLNGIGFDIQIDFGNEKKVSIRYGEIMAVPLNRTINKNDGIHPIQWRRLNKHRIQVGYKFTKPGTYKIDVTFIQPSTKLLNVEMKCPMATVVDGIPPAEQTCFPEQRFYLNTSFALNNVTSATPVLLLPYSQQHYLEPVVTNACSDVDLVYSFYLLSIDSSFWKYSRTQRYSTSSVATFAETFLSDYCSELGPKSTLAIESKSLTYGYYVAAVTVASSTNMADFRQFIQPLEIVRSDLQSSFGGNETITSDGQPIELDFYSNTFDPDAEESDRRKLNFTLICYPTRLQSSVFHPNMILLGATRPNERNPQNHNPWSIQWANLSVVARRPDLNIQFFENQCFSSAVRQSKNKEFLQFDQKAKIFNITEDQLVFNNGTLNFLLIVRHLIDGRQLVRRFTVEKQTEINFDTADLSLLEEAMNNLDDLAAANPQKAVQLITGLADKLNEMSDNSTTGEMDPNELKAMNERMAAMRAKMLSSMDTVLDSANDPDMVDKALKASVTVTANSNQMPLDNQEKGAGIIEKVGSKVKDMATADDNTVTNLATSLLDVGGNVLQAASKTVGKDRHDDRAAIIESAESEMKETENEEAETKVIYAPTQFYEACDECDTLPEERWEQYRQKLVEETRVIMEGRERASSIAKRSSNGLFVMGDVLANRSETDEPKSIESKAMAMTFAKAPPDGKSSIAAGETSIRLPGLADLNTTDGGSNTVTKVLESKENPYASAKGNSSVQGSVVTIILSNPDGSEIPVQHTAKPISIRLTRPVDKRPQYQNHELEGTFIRYHKVDLPEDNMTLSIHISPNKPTDMFAVYISHGINETMAEAPVESRFDLLYVVPNRTISTVESDLNLEDQEEILHTVFLPPGVHFGNGTYIIGVKLINSTLKINLTEYNASYSINMYTSKCQYWDEKNFVWSSAGCQVGPMTTLKSTECLCTHLTTFGSDFYVPPNTIDFKTVFKKFKKLHENAAVFSTVMVIFGLYLISAVWARRKDKQDLVKWTAAPLVDNLPIDTYHYLITVHTGVGKEASTTSNVSFVMSGELADSGVRKLSDGKIQEFKSGSVRNFVMSVESPLGPLLYLRVWHDNSGQKNKASWYLNMINVLDLQSGEKSYFLCDNWLAVEKGDGLVDRVIPLASEKELKSFAHLFTQSVKKKFSDGHLWFSVFSRPVRSNFTRLQRVSCCISLLFCTMISNAMFYRQDTQATANKAGVLMKIGPIEFTLTQLWISFIGTMIVLPVNLLIVTLFRKAKYSQRTLISHRLKETKRRNKLLENDEQTEETKRFFSKGKLRLRSSRKVLEEEIERIGAIPSVEDKTRTFPHWTIYIAWALVMLSICTCSFFIILYSLEWGAKRANEWLITMLLSFGQSVLVIDPLKVFLITAVISFLIRRPYDDETLDFNDPFTGTLLSSQSAVDADMHDTFNDARVKDIARQRRVRLFDLRPIDSNEMSRAREQRLRELKMGEIIREIVVYVCFTTVLLFLSYQARDTNSYGLYRDTKNLFVTDEFTDVSSIPTWWNYCDNVLLKGLYAQQWYNSKGLTWREKLTTGSRVSMRVGAPRIRQLRVKENSCRVHRRVKHVIKHCRDDYNWIDDDTKDYTPRWEKVLNKTAMVEYLAEQKDGSKRCKTPWCYQSSARTKSGPMTAIYKTYKGGGYVVALGRTYEKARTVLTDLRSQNWLDQLTRAVIIDFSLYNANVNLFVAVTLSFEMTSMGSVIQDHQIKVFRLYDHIGGYGILVYIFEFIFVIFTIYSMIHEIIQIVKLRREYFNKFWNVISFITAVFSVTAIGMYGTKKTLTRLAIRSLRKSEMDEFVNFNAIASFDEVYSYIVALITFFTMLKFLKLLRFNKRIGMLSQSLRYARSDLSSFGFVFLIFMLAYAQMGFALFGRSLRSYKSFFTALTTCFRMLLGEINAPDMLAVSRVYGSFYFLSFIILVFIALLSIFLTILNDAFAHVKREMAATQHRNEMMEFMWSAFRKVAGVNNRKPNDTEMETSKTTMTLLNSMTNPTDAPLAKFDGDDL